MIMTCQPTQQQAHNRTSAGFKTIQQEHDYGLTTTQQQAHNRTSEGF